MSEAAGFLYPTRVMHRRLVAPLYRFVYKLFHVLLDVDRASLDRIYGGDADDRHLVTADLLQAGDVARVVDAALARFARIHVLCNLAGGFKMGHAVHETPESTWRLMIGLNVESIINTARAVVPGMLAAGAGI